jgi:hypothetical protein
MVKTYQIIHRQTGADSFDLDMISRILTAHFQASSTGAVGAEALARSHNKDRSRDPLYNQSKMYSELFRMLGWLRPPLGRRLEFRNTFLGDLIAEDWVERQDLVDGLLRESLLAITFPNPAAENIGVTNQRPFRWLLLLTAQLNELITRHEMILGMLTVLDDQDEGALNAAVDRVLSVRGNQAELETALQEAARAARTQLNTLWNYTRFPVGVMKSARVGWGTAERVTGLYERPVSALKLSALGLATAERAEAAVDVRESALVKYTFAERVQFAVFAYFAMLIRAGLEETDVEGDLVAARRGAARILSDLSITTPSGLIYSPFQQAADDVIAAGLRAEPGVS